MVGKLLKVLRADVSHGVAGGFLMVLLFFGLSERSVIAILTVSLVHLGHVSAVWIRRLSSLASLSRTSISSLRG